jgi:hypothetical protein
MLPAMLTETTPLSNPDANLPKLGDRLLTRHEEAAWHVEDAIHGLTPLDYSKSRISSRETYLLHERVRLILFAPTVFISLGLTFLEVPMWCDNGDWLEWATPEELCAAPDHSHVFLSEITLLPKLYSTLLEFIMLSALSICLGLAHLDSKNHADIKVNRPEDYWIDYTRFLLLFLWVFDFVVVLVFNHVLDYNLPLRLTGLLRIAMFCTLDTMVIITVSLRSVGSDVCKVIGMYCGVIGIFSWVGAVALAKNRSVNSIGQDANTGFASLSEAAGTMFFAAELMNLPDSILPAYVNNQSSFLFFAAFLVMTLFFFNMCLAVVYKVYSDDQQTLTRSFFENRARNLGQAFRILAVVHLSSGSMVVTKEDFFALVEHTNQHPTTADIDDAESLELCWSSVDILQSGVLTSEDFYEIMDVSVKQGHLILACVPSIIFCFT